MPESHSGHRPPSMASAAQSEESTEPFPSSEFAERAAEYLRGSEQSTELIPSRELADRIAQDHHNCPQVLQRVADNHGAHPAVYSPVLRPSEESTQVLTSNSMQQVFVTAPEVLDSSSTEPPPHDDRSASPSPSSRHRSPSQSPGDDSLEPLFIRWKPLLRIVFKEPRNLSLEVIDAKTDVLTILPQPTRDSQQPPPITFIGCVQDRSDTLFSLHAGSIQCKFFYIPNSDDIIMYNAGPLVHFQYLSEQYDSARLLSPQSCTLMVGIWRVCTPQHTLDFRLWPRQYSVIIEEQRVLGKRSSGEAALPALKRRHIPGQLQPLLIQDVDPLSPPAEGDTACLAYRLADDQAWLDCRPSPGQFLVLQDCETNVLEFRIRIRETGYRNTRSCYIVKANLYNEELSGKVVAVKTLTHSPTRFAGEAKEGRTRLINTAQRWYAEFRLHRDLDHPQIARLVGYDARIFVLLIEFYQLFDMAAKRWRAKSGLFKGADADARRILADISSALLYLEERGILHNDIKPGNILYGHNILDPRAGAILIDFGLACEEAGAMVHGGTPWYIPREFAVEGQRGYAADVWSLGVTMLYARQQTKLPELTAPGWDLAKCGNGYIPIQMQQWLDRVQRILSRNV